MYSFWKNGVELRPIFRVQKSNDLFHIERPPRWGWEMREANQVINILAHACTMPIANTAGTGIV